MEATNDFREYIQGKEKAERVEIKRFIIASTGECFFVIVFYQDKGKPIYGFITKENSESLKFLKETIDKMIPQNKSGPPPGYH